MTDLSERPITNQPPPAAVKHMKWWGWGVDGVGFHHEDKPALRDFVIAAVGLDLNQPPAPPQKLAELNLPESQLTEKTRAALVAIVGAENVITEDADRIVHTYGKSLTDLVRMRAGDLPRIPDVVVYPGSEADVQALVDLVVDHDAVLIPFGGGSNIVGSLTPPAKETRQVVSLDMGRLNRVLEIDASARLARIQAGVQGPDLEEQLNARGWTIGHFPDSFSHSTLGGWVATRSSGMQSDKYGDISEITKGIRLVQPGQVTVVRPLPSTSTGPSIQQLILGSEGRLGVITEVTVQLHRIPAKREILAYLFPSFSAGLKAMQEISESDASCSVTRVSDANETAFSFATKKASPGLSLSGLVSKALQEVLKVRGWDMKNACLSFIGFEGSASHVALNQNLVRTIVNRHGGLGVGKGPGKLYDQKKFDTPYIRDFLLDRGAVADVSETAAPWSQLQPLYDQVIAAAQRGFAQLGVQGWIMCHLSHSYHSGACLYFTFAFRSGTNPLEQYEVVKSAIQQAFVDHGGTLSHHHAVGTEHRPWLSQDISSGGVAMLRGLFGTVDPGGNFNPGKILS